MTPAHLAAKLSKHFREITPELIEGWERGADEPTPSHVKKLAEIYRRPVAVFLLAQPPDENPLPPDRRTLISRRRSPFSPDTILMIRRARHTQQLAQDLLEDSEARPSFQYRATTSADPASLAARMRADLAVSTKDQFAARTYGDFFHYLRERIEDTGVLTLRSGGHQRFPLEDARALSFADEQPYIILVNNADSEGAKTFSLLHEFAHVLIRQAGICTDITAFAQQHGRVDPLEVFCNQFAADFLVPKRDFLAHRVISGHAPRIEADDLDSIAQPVARDFKVSRFVILRRLLTTGLISRDTYNAKAKEWKNEDRPRRTGGKSIPARTALLNNGPTFSQLVFSAYRADRLSSAALSDYLGIKSKHLPAFARLVQAYERQSLH